MNVGFNSAADMFGDEYDSFNDAQKLLAIMGMYAYIATIAESLVEEILLGLMDCNRQFGRIGVRHIGSKPQLDLIIKLSEKTYGKESETTTSLKEIVSEVSTLYSNRNDCLHSGYIFKKGSISKFARTRKIQPPSSPQVKIKTLEEQFTQDYITMMALFMRIPMLNLPLPVDKPRPLQDRQSEQSARSSQTDHPNQQQQKSPPESSQE